MNRVVHETLNAAALRFFDQRPKLRVGIQAVPHVDLRHPVRKEFGEVVEYRPVNVEAIRRRACLAVVAEFGAQGGGYRLLDIRIVEDDERGVSTKLQGEAKNLVR